MVYSVYILTLFLTLTSTNGQPDVATLQSENKSEIDMRTCEIIQYYGYPCEIHHVTTKDGYILELHRIPHTKGNATSATKGPVFVQHGLICSSFTLVSNPPNMSLPYLLADDGYDVWMGNSRGSTYSRGHTTLHVKDDKYWDFSFDELIKYDLPTMVEYTLKMTKYKKLAYVGHSQGTMVGFGGFSQNKMLASKITVFAAMAPVANLGNMKGALKIMSGGTWLAKQIIKALGVKNFVPSSWIIKTIGRLICHGPIAVVCGSALFLIVGFDTDNLDFQRMPIYLAHTPAGTSVKNILHFTQDINHDKFEMYDYGWNGNMENYLQPKPPQYDVRGVELPTGLFIGEQDWLATPEDINKHIRGVMHEDYIVYDKTIPKWNHMDFVWGKRAKELVYDDLIGLINKYKPKK